MEATKRDAKENRFLIVASCAKKIFAASDTQALHVNLDYLENTIPTSTVEPGQDRWFPG
jgi:hypothetical protein